jgi:hypothetical protein
MFVCVCVSFSYYRKVWQNKGQQKKFLMGHNSHKFGETTLQQKLTKWMVWIMLNISCNGGYHIASRLPNSTFADRKESNQFIVREF